MTGGLPMAKIKKYSIRLILVAASIVAGIFFVTVILEGESLFDRNIRNLRADREKPTVAIVLKALDSEHWEQIKRGAEDSARDYDVNLIVRAPNVEENTSMQFRMVQDLLNEDIDALFIAPCDSDGIVPLIRDAASQDITVMTIDTNANVQAGVASFIGTNNFKAGQLAGERMKEILHGEGSVIVLTGILAQQTHRDRLFGFSDALAGSNLEIGLTIPANSESKLAYKEMIHYIDQGIQIDGIFATNGLMALGAMEALKERGLTDEIPVIAFDYQQDLILAIEEGLLDSTVSQDPYSMGYLVIETYMDYRDGEKIEPYIETQSSIITKSTLE